MRSRHRASPRFRALALCAAFAAWALVVVGGVVRVTGSGLGCPHWPLCTAGAVPLDQRASFIEYSHRAVVAVVIVLVVALALVAWRDHRMQRAFLWPALAAAVLVPVQALLGAVVVWMTLPGWVVGVHFVVGMLFFGTLVYAAAAAWGTGVRSLTPGTVQLAWSTVAVGLLLVCVGATVVAVDAGGACGTQWPGCGGGIVGGGAHGALQVVHRLLAYTVAALVAILFVRAVRGDGLRLEALLALLAVLGQAALGVAMVLVGGEGRTHELLAGLHVGGAASVWAALIVLGVRGGVAPRRC